MFDVGFAELFLLALIGLIVLGPERLPRVARTLGILVRKARTNWFALRNTIESELAATEMSESLKSTRKELENVTRKIDEPIEAKLKQAWNEKSGEEPERD